MDVGDPAVQQECVLAADAYQKGRRMLRSGKPEDLPVALQALQHSLERVHGLCPYGVDARTSPAMMAVYLLRGNIQTPPQRNESHERF